MNSDSKKFFEPIPNYAALREIEEKNYHPPTEEELQDFLLFWNDVYQSWRKLHSGKFDSDKINHKIKLRKLFLDVTK